MAIELKTKVCELYQGPAFADAHDFGLRASTDALAAHALLRAIEEAKQNNRKCDFVIVGPEWIEARSELILADLLAGKQL